MPVMSPSRARCRPEVPRWPPHGQASPPRCTARHRIVRLPDIFPVISRRQPTLSAGEGEGVRRPGVAQRGAMPVARPAGDNGVPGASRRATTRPGGRPALGPRAWLHGCLGRSRNAKGVASTVTRQAAAGQAPMPCRRPASGGAAAERVPLPFRLPPPRPRFACFACPCLPSRCSATLGSSSSQGSAGVSPAGAPRLCHPALARHLASAPAPDGAWCCAGAGAHLGALGGVDLEPGGCAAALGAALPGLPGSAAAVGGAAPPRPWRARSAAVAHRGRCVGGEWGPLHTHLQLTLAPPGTPR